MLGHRGCRLAITYPEITEMQVSAIIEAAIEVQKEKIKPKVEIMIPLIATLEEFVVQEELIRRTAEKIISSKKTKVDYTVGTMIEVPRASLQAGKIAKRADFFSFGTNDLTQLTFGISRDDSAQFILEYLDKGIIERDPFETIDRAGVGELMKIATERGRKTNRKLKIGICGEHGGEPDSIDFCNSIGLNYVSCSPFRVPIARLAAAQAVLKK